MFKASGTDLLIMTLFGSILWGGVLLVFLAYSTVKKRFGNGAETEPKNIPFWLRLFLPKKRFLSSAKEIMHSRAQALIKVWAFLRVFFIIYLFCLSSLFLLVIPWILWDEIGLARDMFIAVVISASYGIPVYPIVFLLKEIHQIISQASEKIIKLM